MDEFKRAAISGRHYEFKDEPARQGRSCLQSTPATQTANPEDFEFDLNTAAGTKSAKYA